jgi:hypothetical protein
MQVGADWKEVIRVRTHRTLTTLVSLPEKTDGLTGVGRLVAELHRRRRSPAGPITQAAARSRRHDASLDQESACGGPAIDVRPPSWLWRDRGEDVLRAELAKLNPDRLRDICVVNSPTMSGRDGVLASGLTSAIAARLVRQRPCRQRQPRSSWIFHCT